MRVLVTGFDPFGGESINPALESIKLLPDNISGVDIVKLQVPTVFYKSIELLNNKIDEIKPNIIISVGQAGGRKDISIERVAINLNDAKIEDNEGNQPRDERIFIDGDDAYFTNLPIKKIKNKIKEFGIPASISNSAGTFVCNHLMYGLLHSINNKYPNIKGGFIHIPYIPEQVVNKSNTASMNIKDIVKALEIAIEVTIENEKN